MWTTGHGERFCEKLFESPNGKVEKPYGSWLRAPNRRQQQQQIGERWLRNGPPETMVGNGGGDGEMMAVDQEDQISLPKSMGTGKGKAVTNGNAGANLGDKHGMNIEDTFTSQNMEIAKDSVRVHAGTLNGEAIVPKEGLVVNDIKRRRTTDENEEVVDANELLLGPTQTTLADSKNLLAAGVGYQACREL